MPHPKRMKLLVALTLIAVAASPVWAAGTATFTADQSGTFGGTFKLDRNSGELTVDLSGIPQGATIFRAELMLRGRQQFQKPTTKLTDVYPVGRPAEKLKFVAPRFVSLDALAAVRAAVRAGEPLKLKLATTLSGATRLEVSYLQAKPKARAGKVSGLKVTHRGGQSLIVFAEPALEAWPEFKTGADVGAFKKKLVEANKGLGFRIWRSSEPITPKTIAKAKLVGRCGLMTGWNGSYHQGGTAKSSPVRYRVTDGGEPVAWGTGIYAHNPATAGKAYYAVTVCVNGEESFEALGPGSTTAEAVAEVVGPGQPVLQWVERFAKGKAWHYRHGPLTRLIYTRWEAWPHSSTPSKPIDYLVAMGDEPKPAKPPRESAGSAYRVDPAPVGLHLHCWGGSCNGGYGWWYNAPHGAVLIASNQVPYDWWTGYHEANGTCKTFGDGHVQPFTMNRTLGFLDWAATQWKAAPESVRKHWRKLDLTRVFTAGSSMGGSGAPMYAVRHGGRIAWCVAWVGVHVPELSPGFAGSYRGNYGRRDPAITMPDGKTSPWDHFSDAWWLARNPKAETGFIMASNGKSDGGIGWPQAVKFARALQQTRRPHLYNWGPGGHGTRTVGGANFNLDVRTDQSLPAFTNGTLDSDIGTAAKRTKAEIEQLKARRIAQAKAAGKDMKRFRPQVTGYDGDESGAYNLHLTWDTGDVVDTAAGWEMTVILKASAPKDSCKVDLTPRRLQKFATPKGRTFRYTVTDVQTGKALADAKATADEHGLLTLKQIPLVKGKNRVKIARSN